MKINRIKSEFTVYVGYIQTIIATKVGDQIIRKKLKNLSYFSGKVTKRRKIYQRNKISDPFNFNRYKTLFTTINKELTSEKFKIVYLERDAARMQPFGIWCFIRI